MLARLGRGVLVLAGLVVALALLRSWAERTWREGDWREGARQDRGRSPEVVEGRARIVDGDTIRLAGRSLRLRGIDAPELRQTCQDAAGAPYRCGEQARRTLAELTEGRPLVCQIRGRDRYRRWLARCEAGGEDVAERLVREGLALAYRERAYAEAEAEAREGRRGLWAGTFQPPETWRRERRERARR